MEAYRSGRNELDSKSSCPQGHVGSNPTASALETLRNQGFFFFVLHFVLHYWKCPEKKLFITTVTS